MTWASQTHSWRLPQPTRLRLLATQHRGLLVAGYQKTRRHCTMNTFHCSIRPSTARLFPTAVSQSTRTSLRSSKFLVPVAVPVRNIRLAEHEMEVQAWISRISSFTDQEKPSSPENSSYYDPSLQAMFFLKSSAASAAPSAISASAVSAASTGPASPDTDAPPAGEQWATFGAGCFWGIELAFQRIPGVSKTEVGYTQGSVDQPSYEAVCSGRTGHVEAVRVAYNPAEVSYEKLLEAFWGKHDPTQLNRQGNDVGTQYRSGIYFYSPEQEEAARKSLAEREAKLGRKIVTEVLPAKKWYRAENYHQQYLARGGRFGFKQSTAKGCNDPIRCYG